MSMLLQVRYKNLDKIWRSAATIFLNLSVTPLHCKIRPLFRVYNTLVSFSDLPNCSVFNLHVQKAKLRRRSQKTAQVLSLGSSSGQF